MEDVKNTPVVILCGGLGLRMRDYSDTIPKALVPVGNLPIVLHVMKIYAHQGYKKFILALGYKGEMIKEYFVNHDWKSSDFILRLGMQNQMEKLSKAIHDFEITFVDTGLDTNTGGRIKKIEKHIGTDNFFATYCDGVADIKLNELLTHHQRMGKIATLTGVHPISPFGILEVEGGVARSFKEKPSLPGLINGGFFVFKRSIFDYLNENSVLEDEPLKKLTFENQLAVFEHNGFWACMDTYKDVERLNGIWENGYMPLGYIQFNKAPWKIWE